MIRFIFCLIIISYVGFASRLDSLENVLKNNDSKNRVRFLNDLSIEYYDKNPNKFLELTYQSLKENEKIEDNLEKFISLTNLAFYYYQKDSIKEKSYYEKAYLILPEIKDNEKSVAYYQLVRNFENKKISDSIYNYSYLAYKFSELDKNILVNLKIRNTYSSVLRNRGNYKEAIKITEEMIDISKKNNLLDWIAQSNAVMGLVLRDWKKYDMSIQKFSEAISQMKEYLINNKMSESQIQIYNSYLFTYYNNLAIIYSELKKFIGADGYGIYKVVHSGSYVEIQEDKITIYKDYVNISFDDNFNYRIVELPSGRVLNYGNNFNNPKIDISFLNHGAYLIEIISGSNFFYKKFIK